MKLQKLASSIAVLGLASALAAPAQAAYQVLDGWGLQSSFAPVSNIGRLNLVSGNATVEQEVNGLGNAFVGARFQEFGGIFSLTYALGRQFNNPVELRGGKIHFGFTSLF